MICRADGLLITAVPWGQGGENYYNNHAQQAKGLGKGILLTGGRVIPVGEGFGPCLPRRALRVSSTFFVCLFGWFLFLILAIPMGVTQFF